MDKSLHIQKDTEARCIDGCIYIYIYIVLSSNPKYYTTSYILEKVPFLLSPSLYPLLSLLPLSTKLIRVHPKALSPTHNLVVGDPK